MPFSLALGVRTLSHEQVLRPSSDFVLAIYTACLLQVTSITQDTLQEPVQAALAAADSPVSPLMFVVYDAADSHEGYSSPSSCA